MRINFWDTLMKETLRGVRNYEDKMIYPNSFFFIKVCLSIDQHNFFSCKTAASCLD